MNNFPIPMRVTSATAITQEDEEVLVYDFIHNTYDPLDTHVLCWAQRTSTWLTIPIFQVTPINTTKKTKLYEGDIKLNE